MVDGGRDPVAIGCRDGTARLLDARTRAVVGPPVVLGVDGLLTTAAVPAPGGQPGWSARWSRAADHRRPHPCPGATTPCS
ncbi:hypothetical protein CNX65_13900 [Actinosynnema pretiosum]|uniref:Uncharacterized protein n=1 Tax=Actinosynnema pretiosum TaxID=42197 RepID=A0A290Z5H7_9PSEU|nr:hypothetical protein CNX65_13900 [Actinosynnema pretiosum]